MKIDFFLYQMICMPHIYALVSGQLILYVGSTRSTLRKRENNHRARSNNCYSKYIPEYIDWTIRLLETVTSEQAITKEQYYYDTLKPLYNHNRPGQSPKESMKQYYKHNSEALKKYQKTYQLKKKSDARLDV